eukprot:TRINITY_DN41120_c0_g1_i1.p1 TRINITY_DN41120_c0_g1~~TRINITY_DN41120_c0_g1_i1.p1  ORF type:complete len:560 (-),score=56.50 TRINITY_DN41120_c0_g1_i1:48-1643(-)
MWNALDLRSMRSLQSQARSQARLLHSRGASGQSGQRLGVGSVGAVRASGSHASGQQAGELRGVSQAASGEREAIPFEEADVLAKMTPEQVQRVVFDPPRRGEGESQSALVPLNSDRQPISFDAQASLVLPSAVLLNVYNLNETLAATNQLLTFTHDVAAIGGAFHVGVEVFDAEYSYGVYGVCCDPSRTVEVHVYQCSIFLGHTALSRSQFAHKLYGFAKRWRGADYDLVAKNCCSFAVALVTELGVEPIPRWVDRFPRALAAGREAGRQAIAAGSEFGRQATVLAVHHGRQAGNTVHRFATEDIPELARVARPHVERVAVATTEAVGEAAVVTAGAARQAASAAQSAAAVAAEEIPVRARGAVSFGHQVYGVVQPQLQDAALQAWQLTSDGWGQLHYHVSSFWAEDASPSECASSIASPVATLTSPVRRFSIPHSPVAAQPPANVTHGSIAIAQHGSVILPPRSVVSTSASTVSSPFFPQQPVAVKSPAAITPRNLITTTGISTIQYKAMPSPYGAMPPGQRVAVVRQRH